MKTLANCTAREFLAQSWRVCKRLEAWLRETGISEIRKTQPEDGDIFRQSLENAWEMLKAALSKSPEKTFELLALLCFQTPESLNACPLPELIRAIRELLNCPEVLDFFHSLAALEVMRIAAGAKA